MPRWNPRTLAAASPAAALLSEATGLVKPASARPPTRPPVRNQATAAAGAVVADQDQIRHHVAATVTPRRITPLLTIEQLIGGGGHSVTYRGVLR
jgi:hypothetical protein